MRRLMASKIPDGQLGKINTIEMDDGRWRATARYKGHDGRLSPPIARIRRTKAMAETAVKAEAGLRNTVGGPTEGENPKVAAAVQGYLQAVAVNRPQLSATGAVGYRVTNGLTWQTYSQYADHGQKIIRALGNIEVRRLTYDNCATFLLGLISADASSGVSTARICRAVLTKSLDHAMQRGWCRVNHAKTVKIPARRVETYAPDVQVLSEIREAFDSRWNLAGRPGPKPSRRVRDIFELLVGTGGRIGEVMALRWCDVDLDVGVVAFNGTLCEKGSLFRQPWLKTRASNRSIRVPSWNRKLLLELHDLRTGTAPTDPVFPTRTGRFTAPSAVRRSIRSILQLADVESVNPHAFRKTVATLLSEDLGDAAAMRQLGHSDERTTRESYIERPTLVPDYTRALERLSPW
ncbi:site-specific integrase [Arthrobacter halodurans]|uniref:Tyrosine recombinase XerC n=1 Tax=Arthrobacter halodurans TaxID=516699 RepID=A0ABV4US21_9MICC